MFLGAVEPWEAHVVESELSGGAVGVEQVAEVCQTVVFGVDDAVEGVEHQSVGGFIEKQLDAQMVGTLDIGHMSIVGYDNHHPVAIGITHRAGVFEVGYLVTLGLLCHPEEADWSAKLEVVLDVVVLGAKYLYRLLVERIVVGSSCAERVPCIATLDFPSQSHGLGLSAVFLLLAMILQFEKQALLTKGAHLDFSC